MSVFFAPTIRKQLVGALEEHLLPIVRSAQPFPMILAEMPMQLPDEIEVTHVAIPPLGELAPAGTREYDQYWPELNMVCSSTNLPYLGFLYEGEADLTVGTSQTMVRGLPPEAQDSDWMRYGYHVLRVRTPTFVLFPPGVPRHSGGLAAHWERAGSKIADSNIFWVQILRDGLHCHLCETRDGEHTGQHSLLIEDDALPAVVDMLHQEMRGGGLHRTTIAHDLLQVLLLRVHRRLMENEPVIANTTRIRAFASSPGSARPASEIADAATPSAIAQADEFISSHLHLPLDLNLVARHCGLSTAQLNRIFRAHLGTSVKQYIIRQRVLAAEVMLRETPMSVKEISRSLGFSQMRNFCRMFHNVAGVSPGQFRKQIVAKRHLDPG